MLGPAAITSALVDLGANVIKVEPPTGDYIRQMTWPIVEGVSLMHLHVNRGKRSITLDLRSDAGKDVFREMARDADVIVEAMRPGALARLGIGPDEPPPRNPEPGPRTPPARHPEAGLPHPPRLRRHGALQGLSEPRHRLRHLGRRRHARCRRRRLH